MCRIVPDIYVTVRLSKPRDCKLCEDCEPEHLIVSSMCLHLNVLFLVKLKSIEVKETNYDMVCEGSHFAPLLIDSIYPAPLYLFVNNELTNKYGGACCRM